MKFRQFLLFLDNEQRVYLNGEEVERDQLEALVIGAVQAIQPEEARRILLKADKVNLYSDIQPLLEVLAKASVPVALGGSQIEE